MGATRRLVNDDDDDETQQAIVAAVDRIYFSQVAAKLGVRVEQVYSFADEYRAVGFDKDADPAEVADELNEAGVPVLGSEEKQWSTENFVKIWDILSKKLH